MGKRFAVVFVSALAVLSFASASASAVPAGNLLQDPGAELDTGSTDPSCGAGAALNGAWQGGTGAFTVVKYGTSGYPGTDVSSSIGGGQNFFTGGCAADSYASERIDVSPYAADFQSGNIQATLSADLGGYLTQEDSADVYAEFESCNDRAPALGTISIGPVTAADRNDETTLIPRSGLGMVPAGTCSINVFLHFHRVTGTDDDGVADNISLSLADLSTHMLTVNVSGTGSGTVTGDQSPQIQCQPTCQQAYQPGTVVTLTEAPSSRSAFTGWSGACTGTATTCMVTLNADVTVNATFSPANSSSVPVNTRLPSITGTAGQNETLNTDGGLWRGGVTSLSYQWLRCASGGGNCLNIPGATSSSYTQTGDDVDATIRVRVTAHNGAGSSAPADSDPTAVVAAGTITAHLTISPNPSCTGIPTVLDASGSFSPDGIRSYSFSLIDFWQWFQANHTGWIGEPDVAFPIAVEADDFLDGTDVQYLMDHFASTVVTAQPRLTETYDWDRDFMGESGINEPGALVRDPVGVVLVVTDYAGHTARAIDYIHFSQPRSYISRADCPPPPHIPISISRLAALKRFLYSGAGLTTSTKCQARTACVGAVVVRTTCNGCAHASAKHAKLLARGFFHIRPHKKRKITLVITRQGHNALRALRRGASLKVVITESSVDPFGRQRIRSYTSSITR